MASAERMESKEQAALLVGLKLIDCTFEAHAETILDIFNDAIARSTSLYENDPRDMAFMVQWFAEKKQGNYPVIGLEDESGALVGFATYGLFRSRPCYRFTIEHSVYIKDSCRGRGAGKTLLLEILQCAERQSYHVVVGVIDSGNAASLALHEKCGFDLCGTVKHAGFKFDRWLDTCIMQKILPAGPAPPPNA